MKLQLRSILIVPFVLQIFAAVGLTGWLSLRNGQRAVNDLATQLRGELAKRIQQTMNTYLETPHLVTKINADALRLGVLNVNDFPSLERYFFSQIQQFNKVSNVALATEQGEYVGVTRQANNSFILEVSDRRTGYNYNTWRVDKQGKRLKQLERVPNYDPRQRDWYKTGAKARKPIWTDIYTYIENQQLAITADRPLYNSQGKLVGIMTADLILSQISDFLRSLQIGETGQAFIMERSGLLVGTSSNEKPFRKHQGKVERLKAWESRDPLTKGTAQYLLKNFADLKQIQGIQQLDFKMGSDRLFLEVLPYKDKFGLDWLIVIVVPEKDFMAHINANTRITILLCFAALVIATMLGIYTSRWISKPILCLVQSAEAMSKGDLDQQVSGGKIAELNTLASAFNQMAIQLNELFHTLEQRVQERTEALRISQERLQLVNKSVNDGIWDWDISTNQVYLAPQWKMMLGYSDSEIPNEFYSWENLVHPDDLPEAKSAIQDHLEGRTENFHIEFRMRHKQGHYLWILSRAKVVVRDNSTGKPIRMVGSHTDISDRKQTDLELQKAKEAADKANQAKSEFLANMSHELRTPLNSILGYAQIMQRSDNLNQHYKGIKVIEQAGNHLLTLINDILDLAKIEARKMELLPKNLHFHSFLFGVVEIAKIRADNKNIVFHFVEVENLPNGVIADEKRLRQVLLNLLGNAIKFTDSGSVTFKVEVLKQQANTSKIRFTIQDTGIGMSPEQLAKIFLPFEQVGSQYRRAEGTGLGLTICSQIVAMMGSKIQVSSQLGVGSIFWFDVDLPLSNEWINTAASSEKGKIINYEGERKKILIVDDKEVNRMVIVEFLKPLGFLIAEAENGREGLTKLAEFAADLIITDIAMPEMNGYEFVREIRQLYPQKLPVIASSASVSQSDQSLAIASGCNDFLEKPIDLEKLLIFLQKYLNLQWIYENKETETQPEQQEIIFPTSEELKTLYKAIKIGDITAVEEEAKRLAQMNSQYQDFRARILSLAAEFDESGIIKLIEFRR
ncbi:ATP-binding protein [Floridanema evergladense]|uniref:histidine kinase n=1 Tax=Floridaenema evergladense BLCC-F167 TaxID=3153639 RepID=A0ABV4WYN0_9CYAN